MGPFSDSARSERIAWTGPAGLLEGIWRAAGPVEAGAVVILAHPHPLYGGSMHTKLVVRVAEALSVAGYHSLRFNFRGVGQSEGSWDEGRGEREDLVSTLAHARARIPGCRVALFGFSFGGALVMDVGVGDGDVGAIVAVAPPHRLLRREWPEAPLPPLLIVGAEKDDVIDAGRLARWSASLPDTAQLVMIPDAGHLFTSEIGAVADRTVAFISEHCPPAMRS